MKYLKYLSLWVLIVVFPLSSFPLIAETSEEVTQGSLIFETKNSGSRQAPLLKTLVSMDIHGLAARVKVTQSFINESSDWVEGKYVFPLPDKSAVDHLEMKIGERLIIGEIKEKTTAKKIYQSAKISGKKASLIEQHKANVFSSSVANIAPYETIEITIEYQQDVLYQKDDGYSIRFPMTMTPRYKPSKIVRTVFDKPEDGFASYASSVVNSPKINEESQRENIVLMDIRLNAGFSLDSLESTSHSIISKQASNTDFVIELDRGKALADRDFILNWQPVNSSQPRAAIFSETKNNEHFANIMIIPPDIDSADSAPVLSREVIFVIDTSGSMAGESIKQAKYALSESLNTLRSGDWFNIIEFNSRYRRLFSSARVFDRSSKKDALDFIRQLRADGGTEMLSAMRAALDDKVRSNKVRQVIFLTDGAIDNESELFAGIKSHLGNSRLFTIGIGSAPNAFFMKKAASYGRGTFTFIGSSAETSSKIQSLMKQISRPQLSHIDIRWPDGMSVDMWPRRVPDLYSGEPLWIKVKLPELKGRLALEGRMEDTLWQTDLSLSGHKSMSGVSKLWAREKIAGIMEESQHGRVSPEQRSRIVDVALKHHLVSRFTSLVAVDKTPARVAEKLVARQLPVHKPKGQLAYPKTALDLGNLSVFNWMLFVFCCGALVMVRRCL
ncbi:marine proteobacterial sortase target protein [Pleionea sp. CnH1-48]|uniref:marine proteobacterial sortase target protein n=1 Tax=Pleionea sp. CnH1-48 TaxID=2954494 RepID=UPI00209739C5|nr:marine proteobacterial sortase target protein [Pleionea sp. CnH1-48]MCO7226742.1 marine proteobacterial sortase target protein [Pleionea sp. CnH1-48]